MHHYCLRRSILSPVIAVSSALILAACSSDTRAILAPSNALISLAPSAPFVVVDQPVEMTVQATKSDGSPVQDGTEIVLTASAGAFESSRVRTSGGVATTVYYPEAVGPIQLVATSDAVQAEFVLATASAVAAQVSLVVSPEIIPPGGGEVEIKVVVLGPSGQRVAGAPVELLTTSGTFAGAGGGPGHPVITNGEGEVTVRLSSSEAAEVRARVHAVESTPLQLRVGLPLDPWDDPELPFRLRDVGWLHADVTEWRESSRIRSVDFSVDNNGDVRSICFPHSKAGRWPVSRGGEGNVWVFGEIDGRWYAGTWDWLKPGQICKSAQGFAWGDWPHGIGHHVHQAPLNTWKPRSGELIGIMVSGFARDSGRNILERSNIYMIEWP